MRQLAEALPPAHAAALHARHLQRPLVAPLRRLHRNGWRISGVFANTFLTEGKAYHTRRSWGAVSRLSQLDYALLSDNLCANVYLDNDTKF